MTYGIQIDGVDLANSSLSVITKGSLTAASSTFYTNITKSDFTDVSEFKVVFIATGIRDTSVQEVRPFFSESGTFISIGMPANAAPHQYLVLGR